MLFGSAKAKQPTAGGNSDTEPLLPLVNAAAAGKTKPKPETQERPPPPHSFQLSTTSTTSTLSPGDHLMVHG